MDTCMCHPIYSAVGKAARLSSECTKGRGDVNIDNFVYSEYMIGGPDEGIGVQHYGRFGSVSWNDECMVYRLEVCSTYGI